MKKFFSFKSVAASLAIVAIGAGTAFAQADISGSNNTTGENSVNTSHVDLSKISDFDYYTNVSALNNLAVKAESGKNKIAGNTEAGDIMFGGVNGDIDISTHSAGLGPVIDLGDMDMGSSSIDLGNSLTGYRSRNVNNVDLRQRTSVHVINDSNVDNNVSAYVSTGGNKISHNTKVGDVTGGDATYSISIDNPSSSTDSGSIIFPSTGGTVSADFSNDTTGACSENENTLHATADTSVNVHNSSNVSNDVHATVNSGHNTFGGNTVLGDISTGDSSLSVHITN